MGEMDLMEIVVGTYEEVLVGLHLKKEGDVYKLVESFTDKSHIGSIKCVAISKKGILASGGIDEIIHVFNLETHRLLGTLTHHSGTVTSLEFFKNFDLFSTSEDGTLCTWRVANWQPRTFKGHKDAVNCVAVHPSGKLAFTVGQDKSLRLWNLVDGRPAFTSNIKQPAELVQWSPDGQYYMYLIENGKKIEVYSMATAQIHKRITARHRVNSIVFVTDTILAFAGEGGITKESGGRQDAVIFFYDFTEGTELHQIETECTRIRDLAVCPSHEEPESGEKWLTSVASDGTISVHRVHATQTNIKTELMVSRNITLRLTCVAVTSPKSTEPDVVSKKQKKRKRKQMKANPEAESDSEPSEKKLKPSLVLDDDSTSDEKETVVKKKKTKHPTSHSVPGVKMTKKKTTMKKKMKKANPEGSVPVSSAKKLKKNSRIAESAPVQTKFKKGKKNRKIKSDV